MKIDWSKIDTVLLDMDGTLLDLHYDNYFWQHYLPSVYAQQHELPIEHANDHMLQLLREHAGTLNWYCVDFWSDALQVDIMQHKEAVADRIGYLPQAQNFLQACQQRVDDLRLITNGHRKVLELKMQRTGLQQYFASMTCSHELGAAKEHQDFWHRLQDQQAFDPDTTLFIDDSESVLEAADRYGIAHVYSIAQPDTQREREQSSKFHMLESLHKIVS